MKLAISYGLFRADFEISPEEMILADNHLLNELIKAENKAQEEAIKRSKEKKEHPGMEKFESEDDFWSEVEEANEETKQ